MKIVMYRDVAEKLVEVYDFDWQDNLKMKEACICSVESVIANGINISLIVLLAVMTGLWREIAIYFVSFASMRFYAGGAHAKNYLQCITFYICIMLTCIVCAKSLVLSNEMMVLGICCTGIVVSRLINGKFAARHKNVGTRSDIFRRKALIMHGTITAIMFGMFIVYMLTGNTFVAEMLIIQSFALMTQSIALFMERKECIM